MDDDTRARARAMVGAGLLHENRGQYSTAEGLLSDALPLAHHASDQALVGWCSIVQGLVARDQGQYEAARRLLEDGISIARLNGAPWMVEVGLLWLASVERYTGNHTLAMQLFNQSLEIGRSLEDRLVTARVLAHLSGMFSEAGNAARAQVLAEECRTIGREAGSRWTEGIGLIPLAIALTQQARLDDAETVLRDVFQVFRDIGDGARVAYALHTLAHVAQAKGEHMRSALLLGAARAVRRRQGEAQMTGLVPPGSLNPSREALGERAFDEAVQAGDQLTASEIASLVFG
jgi:tetratricopeptide (TPR) repeat protein